MSIVGGQYSTRAWRSDTPWWLGRQRPRVVLQPWFGSSQNEEGCSLFAELNCIADIHNQASVCGYEHFAGLEVYLECRFQDPHFCVRGGGAGGWGKSCPGWSGTVGIYRQSCAADINYVFSNCCSELFHNFFLKLRQEFEIMVLPGERVSAVVGHLNPTKAMGRASLLMKNPDDIVNIRQLTPSYLICCRSSRWPLERLSRRLEREDSKIPVLMTS